MPKGFGLDRFLKEEFRIKKSTGILIACIIVLSMVTIITAADNGKKIDVYAPSFVAKDATGLISSDVATENVFVGLRNKPGTEDRLLVLGHKGKIRNEFVEEEALAVEIPADQIDALSRDPRVSYIEEDPVRYPLALEDSELVPSLSNGLYGLITTKATDVHARGITGAGVTACIADTAIDISHPDLANLIETGNYNSRPIDLANETHATHVAGTVVAAMNNMGIRGVAYNAGLYHARVLGPNGGLSSEVMSGVQWLVETKGCKIVGLSPGSPTRTRTEEKFYKRNV